MRGGVATATERRRRHVETLGPREESDEAIVLMNAGKPAGGKGLEVRT